MKILIKGHLWHLTINTLKHWREMREPPDAVPYFYIGKRPGYYEKEGIIYYRWAVYFFPFIFRCARRSNELTLK